MDAPRLTIAIHTYPFAIKLKAMLENEGIPVWIENVNLESPDVSAGVRVRIRKSDLPLALRVIEHADTFVADNAPVNFATHSILVPVDCSDMSYNACRTAFGIAKRHNADIVIIHSYIDPYLPGNLNLGETLNLDLSVDTEARRQLRQSARMALSRFMERLNRDMAAGKLPDVTVTTHIAEGVPEDVILEYAKTDPPYLIVMATRGSARKTEEMIGSVTSEVLDKSPYTVLAIPEPSAEEIADHSTVDESPRNILLLANLEQEDILVMDTLARIFAKPGAQDKDNVKRPKITIARMPSRRLPYAKSIDVAMQNLQGYCQRNFPAFDFETTNFAIERDFSNLQELTDKLKTDLILAPNKRKNAFARLLGLTAPNRILFSNDLPVLVVRV